jgi:hypothetical protein
MANRILHGAFVKRKAKLHGIDGVLAMASSNRRIEID